MTQRIDPESGLFVIDDLSHVPSFATEREEADFWATHTFSEELLEAEFEPETDEEFESLRGPHGLHIGVEAEIAERLRAVARRKHVDYVALTRQFICERLYEEEKREGIIPS